MCGSVCDLVFRNSSFVGAADIIICCRRPAFERARTGCCAARSRDWRYGHFYLNHRFERDEMQVAVARANSDMLEYKNWNPMQRLDVLSISWIH